MRVLIGLLITIVVSPIVPAAAVLSSTPITASALPVGVTLAAQTNIPGLPGRTAVLYIKGSTTRLGLVRHHAGKDILAWSRPLGSGGWTLSAPGQDGLIAGISQQAASGETKYAYLVSNAGATSAILGVPSGMVTGDIDVLDGARSFRVRSHDSGHAGSVRYRTVTAYTWTNGIYVPGPTRTFPDYPNGQAPRPNATMKGADGSIALIKLQIADTSAECSQGLMFVKSMDPDSGMIFIWHKPTQEGFWMENTYIPLSIAWIDANGKVVDIQDMQALSTDVHYPAQPYVYAVEANLGYFAAHDVAVGSAVRLHLGFNPMATPGDCTTNGDRQALGEYRKSMLQL